MTLIINQPVKYTQVLNNINMSMYGRNVLKETFPTRQVKDHPKKTKTS